MVAAQLPECDVEDPGRQLHDDTRRDVGRRLFEEHRVEALVHRWRGRPLVRASFQGYNSEEDLDRLVEGLRRVLGARLVAAPHTE
jgi:selenocysteine lyase/cysteine desulfurase